MINDQGTWHLLGTDVFRVLSALSCAFTVSYMKERCYRSSSLSYFISSSMLASNISLGGVLSISSK